MISFILIQVIPLDSSIERQTQNRYVIFTLQITADDMHRFPL